MKVLILISLYTHFSYPFAPDKKVEKYQFTKGYITEIEQSHY